MKYNPEQKSKLQINNPNNLNLVRLAPFTLTSCLTWQLKEILKDDEKTLALLVS